MKFKFVLILLVIFTFVVSGLTCFTGCGTSGGNTASSGSIPSPELFGGGIIESSSGNHNQPSNSATLKVVPVNVTVPLENTKQFQAHLKDGNTTIIPSNEVAWSVEGEIGVIDSDGIFTATQEGEGKVIAVYKGLSAYSSVRVIKNSSTPPITPPLTSWRNCFGGTGLDIGRSIQQTSDGGYVILGFTESNDGDVFGNHGGKDMWVIKLSGASTIQWKTCLGGPGEEYANSIQQTSDGGYIVLGSINCFTGYVVKLSSDGVSQWEKYLSGINTYSIQQTSDGGYVVAGFTTSGNTDYCIVKLNSNGDTQWQKRLGGSNGDYAYSIRQTTDGGYIVAGGTYSNDGDVSGNKGDIDYWIVKLNPEGIMQWQKCLGGSGRDIAQSIAQTSDGGYIAVGFTYSNNGDVTLNHGISDYLIVRLDQNGNLVWQKSFGGSYYEEAYSVQETTDGGYIVAGCSNSGDGDVLGNHYVGSADYWILKLASGGNIQWQKCFGGSGQELAYSIQQTSDGGYVMAGSTASSDGDAIGFHGFIDYLVIKTDSNGR